MNNVFTTDNIQYVLESTPWPLSTKVMVLKMMLHENNGVTKLVIGRSNEPPYFTSEYHVRNAIKALEESNHAKVERSKDTQHPTCVFWGKPFLENA